MSMPGAPGETYEVGGLAGFSATVDKNIANAQAMLAAEQKLIKEGFGKTSLFHDLAASGDVQTATELASLSKSDAQAYIDKYNLQNSVAAQAGKVAGQAVFGDDLQDALKAVAQDRATLKLLDGTIKDLQREIRQNGKRTEDGARTGVREGLKDAASGAQHASRNRARS